MDQQSAVVMCFSGNDPTGGAGLAADIEAIASMGAQAAPVVTALTVQDTVNVKGYSPIDLSLINEQARAVLEDMPVDAFKIGMLGSVEAVEAVHTLLVDYPDVPVVFDPLLVSGGGNILADEEMRDAMAELLFPQTTVLTPNSQEARAFAHEADTLDACAQELMDKGCEYILITGSHENTPEVINTLYCNNRPLSALSWERLPNTYHGSGCTLAAAIAALLAQGIEPLTAAQEAQHFVFESLKAGFRIGMGQHHPNRFFWAAVETEAEE